MNYEKYYLEEGKTSKCMIKEITNRDEFETICRVLKECKVGAYLSGDGYVHARVGAGKDGLKAQICKDLGFRYIRGDYWTGAYNEGVKSLREFGV